MVDKKSAAKAPAKTTTPASKVIAPTKAGVLKKTDTKAAAVKTDSKKKDVEKVTSQIAAIKIEETKVEEAKPQLRVFKKEVDDLMQDVRSIEYLKLASYLEAAQMNGKYVLIFDQTNNCHTYFGYKGIMKDFHSSVVKVRLGLGQKEEVLEDLRTGIIVAMRLGSNFVINLDQLNDVDFKAEWTNDTQFPMQIFNRDEWFERDNYMKIVKPEENKRFENDEDYEMHQKFNVVINCTYTTDEDIVRVTHKIPHWDDFSIFIVKTMTPAEQAEAERVRKETGMNTMADANKYRDLTKGYGEGFLTAEQAKVAAANIKGIQN